MASAPGIFTITSNDTLIINGQLFTTLSDKSTVHLDFPNDVVNVTVGKNGNAIFASNAKGSIGDMELRPLMANADHSFLNNQLSQYLANPPSYVVMNGAFTKVLGDGQGNVRRFSYNLNGGVVLKNIMSEENVEGETDQAIAIFKIRWAQCIPIID